MNIYNDSELRQKERFDQLGSEYDARYGEYYSRKYRMEFLYPLLFQGTQFKGKTVLDALCGTGQVTEYLVEQGAEVTGLDISDELINFYRHRWGDKCTAVSKSIFETGFEDNQFDYIVVLGALHHLHPQVPEAIDEIFRILKPGGLFFIAEPHQGSIFDIMRKAWYSMDHSFEENEASIDMDVLKTQNSHRFKFLSLKYYGNIAYLLVFQSWGLRIPNRVKKYYSSILMKIERAVTPLLWKGFSFGALAIWEKTELDGQ